MAHGGIPVWALYKHGRALWGRQTMFYRPANFYFTYMVYTNFCGTSHLKHISIGSLPPASVKLQSKRYIHWATRPWLKTAPLLSRHSEIIAYQTTFASTLWMLLLHGARRRVEVGIDPFGWPGIVWRTHDIAWLAPFSKWVSYSAAVLLAFV